MFSSFGLGYYFYYMYATSIITIVLMGAVYILPFLQLLISGERKKWLERHFEENESSGESENAFRSKMLIAAGPVQSFPLYKLLKFYLISSGIMALIIGLLVMLLPESMMDREGLKILIFIPLLVGVSIYFIYDKFYRGQGLWREITATFLLLGVAVTGVGVYSLHNLDEFISSDIFIYLILGFGLYVVHKFNSVVASYLYLVLVGVGSTFVYSNIGYNWMMFTTHFIWFFALAILSFWLPRLRAAKQIEFREIVFGILFFFIIMSLGINNTSGLGVVAVVVLMPCLYIFSKIHFKKANWFGGRPIETLIILIIIISLGAFSFQELVYDAQRSISIFTDLSFHKIVAFLFIVIAGIITYTMYSDQTKKDQKSINLYIVFAPLGIFLFVYILGDYGTQYLANIFLLFLGFDYLRKGLLAKDVVQLFLATVLIIASIIIRLVDLEELLQERFFAGLIILFFGALYIGLALYMRDKWSVTGQCHFSGGNMKINDDQPTADSPIEIE